MAYVYILESEKNGKYYIGSTIDYEARLKQHNSGNVTFTRSLRPWNVVFFQKYETVKKAREIEIKLKKFKSRIILNRIIKDKVIKMGQ